MKSLALVLLLAPIAFISGCSYQAPTLRVTNVKLTDRTDTGVVILVSLEAENRNEVELPLRDIHYTVSLDNGWTFTGVRSPEAFLRRLGTQEIHIPAAFAITPESPFPSGEGGVLCTVSGRLGYTTPGQFAQDLFDSGVRRTTVAFRNESKVSLNGK